MGDVSRELCELLGLPGDASFEAIRKRYRELARKYHPDVNPGDDRAHARFRAIVAAYEELAAGSDRFPITLTKVKRPSGSQPDIPAQPVVPLQNDAPPFRQTAASLPKPPPEPEIRIRDHQTPPPKIIPVTISLAQAVRGASVGLLLPDGTKMRLPIPPGVDHGTTIPLPIAGKRGQEILVEVRVRSDRLYKRRGADLIIRVSISVEEAYRGTTLDLVTPSGPLKVKVPERSRHGDVVRVVGKGVPSPAGRGDLYVELGD